MCDDSLNSAFRTPHSELGKAFALVIPAYNEEASLGALLDEVAAFAPAAHVIVVSDGSLDDTAAIARAKGAEVLDLACNIGVGGVVQAGLAYARQSGFDMVVRIDGDGQHPPSEIHKLVAFMRAHPDVDLVTGSRFLEPANTFRGGTRLRRLGNMGLAKFLSLICRAKVTDPTSGFWCVRGELLRYFALNYPSDYPEPEALALMRRQGYEFREVGVCMRKREHGKSTIDAFGSVYFLLRVGLALVADRVRPVDKRFRKTLPQPCSQSGHDTLPRADKKRRKAKK